MKRILAAFGIVALLAGCAGTPPAPAPNPASSVGDTALSSTSAGQNVLAWISGLNTNLASAESTVNGVIQASQPALQNLLALGNTLYTAYQLAAPVLGASSADSQQASAAIATLQSLAASNPTDIASAVVAATKATATLKQALSAVAPQAAAAVTAPLPAAS